MPNDSEDYLGGQVTLGDTFTARGDIAGFDLEQDTMTLDGALHDWDISGIVAAGTKLVKVGVRIADNVIVQYIWLQKKGYENFFNASYLFTQVANKTRYNEFDIPVDPDVLIIEYATSAAAIDVVSLYVKGWWS